MEEKNTVEVVDVTEEKVEEIDKAAEEVTEVAAEKQFSEDEYFEMTGLTAAQRKRREIFDKITTGILIALMASPIFILAYIFLWFVLNITSR